MKYFLAILLLIGVYKVVNQLGATDVSKSFQDTKFIMTSDGGDISRLSFIKEEKQDLELFVFGFGEGNGQINQLGTNLFLSYLVPEKMDIFNQTYKSDIKRCPASFLNSNTGSLGLIGVDEETSKRLQAVDLEGRERGVHLNLTGSYLTYDSGNFKDGKPFVLRTGRTRYFLVENFYFE